MQFSRRKCRRVLLGLVLCGLIWPALCVVSICMQNPLAVYDIQYAVFAYRFRSANPQYQTPPYRVHFNVNTNSWFSLPPDFNLPYWIENDPKGPYLPSIITLSLRDISRTQPIDLSPIRHIPIKRLFINKCPIDDYSPLNEMDLDWLQFSCHQLVNLQTIKGIKVDEVSFYNSGPLNWTDLEAIQPSKIEIEECTITGKVSVRLPRTKDVYLCKSQANGLTALQHVQLKSFSLVSCSGIYDLSLLKKMPLEELYLSMREGQVDLAPIAQCPLKKLGLFYMRVTDLSPLQGLQLQAINFRGVPVEDLTPLVGMPLAVVNLQETRVKDLSPLKGMPLKELDITGTPAAKKPLPGWLVKSGCKVVK